MDEVTAMRLRSGAREAYSAVGDAPQGEHPFPVGEAFARSLGYPEELLLVLPVEAKEAFTGVAALSVTAGLSAGQHVLDLGCGAGLDSLIAARQVAPDGFVTGIDFSAGMLRRARKAAAQAAARGVVFLQAAAERLPFPDAAVDVVLVNGIFNLNPWRELIFTELARVLRPGGQVYAAELILLEGSQAPVNHQLADWFA